MIHEATITYDTIDVVSGNEKTVKENYLVCDENCFGDAEHVVYDRFQKYNALDVVALKRSRIKELINEREHWGEFVYVGDISDVQTNENGEAIEIIYKVALFAENMEQAYQRLKEYLQQGYDMIIVGLKKSRIKDAI